MLHVTWIQMSINLNGNSNLGTSQIIQSGIYHLNKSQHSFVPDPNFHPTTKDIIWLSGILEGEGCFSKCGNKITIQLQMTDKDTVQKAYKIFNSGGSITPYFGNKVKQNKTIYCITIRGDRAAMWMMTLYSLMGERRKEKIKSLLSFWKSYKPNYTPTSHRLYYD